MKEKIGGAYAWIGTSVALIIYALLGLFEVGIPGVEEIVGFISGASGHYIYLAAFIAILIEGLYIAGSFFPGSTFVLLTAVLSQLVSPAVFLGTIITIFCGWCLAGAINIFIAYRYHRLQPESATTTTPVADNLLTTWFPAFRASYEVAQIAEGHNPWLVLRSSIRVKFWASLAAASVAFVIPFFIDVGELNNEEGFASVLGVATITLSVGLYKIYRAKQQTNSVD